MKKLALALVCMFSVAFFASCVDPIENPEPSIAVITGENYLTDGKVIDFDVYYHLGFTVASNPQTQYDLYRFKLIANPNTELEAVMIDTVISGKTFIYDEEIIFPSAKEIVGTATFTATVTDANGEQNTATLTVSLDQVTTLTVTDFEWNRHGGNAATGNLGELGLEWKTNGKEIYAVITPKEGAVLYQFETERDIWNSVTTELEKAALFSEANNPVEQFKEISCTAEDKDYDFVIGTVYEGKYNLIHVTHSHVFTFKGTDVTITGQVK